jgi:translation initiation factor IF-1
MPKKDNIEVEGVVVEPLPNPMDIRYWHIYPEK